MATKFDFSAFHGELFIIVRNRLTSVSIAPRTARFVGILLELNKETFFVVIQLLWYILKQLFTSVSVKVVDIYLSTTIHLHFGE